MKETTTSAGRIVVGVDGSPGSKLALSWAARVARHEQAGIDVIAAWEFPLNVGWTTLPADYSPKHDMEKAAIAAVDEVFGPDRPADLRVITREGNAAAVLTEKSQAALMIVVGSRGHGGFMGLLLGSVSALVAEHAACPVLVVHAPKVPDALTFELDGTYESRNTEIKS